MPRLIIIGVVAGLFSALFGVRRGGTPGSPASPLLFAFDHKRFRGCAGPSPASPAIRRLVVGGRA